MMFAIIAGVCGAYLDVNLKTKVFWFACGLAIDVLIGSLVLTQ